MKRPLSWIESHGGPLLFAPKSALKDWKGSIPDSNALGPTDYDRACAVTAEIDAISIRDKQALVLGDEPDRTALLPFSSTDVFIIRWRWAESEEALLSLLEAAQFDQLPFTPVGVFESRSEEYKLFDSAYAGTNVECALSALLIAETYSFESLDFRPNKATCLLVHRLRPKRYSL